MRFSKSSAEFVPGRTSHCQVSREDYMRKVLETLSIPGGVPSVSFCDKFKADHGLVWDPEWAGITKLEDLLKEHQVARWATDQGRLVFGTKTVLIQKVFGEQKPPQPVCTLKKDGKIWIMPFLQFSWDDYEMADEVRKELKIMQIDGMKIRLRRKGRHDAEFHLKSLPWVLDGFEPWFQYEVLIQYVCQGQLTRPCDPVVIDTNLNQIHDFHGWKEESLWMGSFFLYKKKVSVKKLRNKVKKFIDLKVWKNNIKKSKASDRFTLDNIQPVRLTMITSKTIQGALKSTLPTWENEKRLKDPKDRAKIIKLIAGYGESIMAVHVLLKEKSGNRSRLAVMKGFTKDVKHQSEMI